jgi:hypothetical protein
MLVTIVLIVVWAVVAVVGFAVTGLLWLGVVGLILLAGTIAFGIVRHADRKSNPT